MSEKKAFVILPYTPTFKRVYSIIIKPAVEDMGYTCIPLGQQGHIMRAVVQNLAEADIVIADLTDLNWNVAYELGIRHTMYRNGTILMFAGEQDEKGKFASEHFDIQHFDILYYPKTWLEDSREEQVIAALKKRIEDVEQNRNPNGDSPVHDIYDNLPPSFRELIAADGGQQAAARIRELETENAKLRSRVENAGLNEENAGGRSTDLRSAFREAIGNGIYYSDDAVRKLRELKDADKLDEFADFLALVLQKGYLDEYDCRAVYNLCRNINSPLTRIYLEEVVRLYPDNEEMNGFLARELCKGNETRDRALALVNDMVGVTRKNGKYELTGNKHVEYNTMGSFLTVYLAVHKQTDLLQIAPLLLKQYQKTSIQTLIYRNMITANLNIDQPQEALRLSEELLRIDPGDDSNHYIRYKALRAADQMPAAAEEMENCIRLCSDYFDYYLFFAGFIVDERIARTDLQELPQSINENERAQYAVPFVIYGVSMQPRFYQRALDYLRRNGFDDVYAKLVPLLQQNVSGQELLEAFSEFSFDYVTFCQEKDI